MVAPVQVVRPDPDPTVLTTENLRREISNLKDLIESRIGANDKAIELVQASSNKFREDNTKLIDDKVTQLHTLIASELDKLSSVMNERFMGVAAQFSERDTRTDQRAGDTKLAVDAAFAAAKEATSKIEAGFTKSIDGQQDLMNTNTKATDDKISDLKDRITAMESRTQGIGLASQERRDESKDSRGLIGTILGVVGIFISFATLVLLVVTRSIH